MMELCNADDAFREKLIANSLIKCYYVKQQPCG